MNKTLNPTERTRRSEQERYVYTVPEAGSMVGLSRNGSYRAAKNGTIPTITFGKMKKVPAAAWHMILGK